ncbi:MAG TPA: hypothetical protein PKA10_10395 [Selenomonadales bacterium]|nr:hypothetical protein [Selenomonadales bacterium]
MPKGISKRGHRKQEINRVNRTALVIGGGAAAVILLLILVSFFM